jgi:hypothetical protein
MMEWVVDTGHPSIEARISQVPAANRAEIIPNIRFIGCPENALLSTIPSLIVFTTSPPAR